MSCDNSFNDSDEICNFYSAKKFTETFKAQFQKLISNKSCVTTPVAKNRNVYNKIGTATEGDVDKSDSVIGEVRTDCTPENVAKEGDGDKSHLVIDEVSRDFSIPIEVVSDNDSDHSIEIIKHNASGSDRRISQRLRNKKQQGTSILNEYAITFFNDDYPNTRSRAKTRKKSTKGCRKKQKHSTNFDTILIDSPQQSEACEDEINPEISVKVIWKSVNIKKFYVRRFQKLLKIFKELSEEENIPQDRIVLSFNNTRVNPNDTPDSLNLQVFHFLDGGVLSEVTNTHNFSKTEISNIDDNGVENQNEDFLTLKFQDVNKKTVKLTINKNEKMKIAMIKYSEALEIPLKKIKFLFDGEELNSSETPLSIGIENDEVIDIKICQE